MASSTGNGGFWKPADVTTGGIIASGTTSSGSNNYKYGEQQYPSYSDDPYAIPPVAAAAAVSVAQPPQHKQQQNFQQQPSIAKHERQILYCLEQYKVVVLVGETGSGKSTQLPQYLYHHGWCDNGFSIAVCGDAATSQQQQEAAQRVAQQLNANHGGNNNINHRPLVRFDDTFTRNSSSIHDAASCKIKFITNDVLLQEAACDPLLSKYSAVVLDDAHERTTSTDLLAGLLKQIRRQRPALRLVVCSAMATGAVAQAYLNFFCGAAAANSSSSSNNSSNDNAIGTILSVDDRPKHPVNVLHLRQPATDYVTSTVETAWHVFSTTTSSSGDILCFLPTGHDVDVAIRLAEDHFDAKTAAAANATSATRTTTATTANVDFLALYGNLTHHQQSQIFDTTTAIRNKKRKRRIIFATSIAETSVTVPNIQYVIDCGLSQLPYFDPVSGLERLVTAPISRASAQQRASRAGRSSMRGGASAMAGQAYRLYTQDYFLRKMQADTVPEILRTNLTSFLLTLKRVGVDNILQFDLLDIPSVPALQHGLETLYALGALDDGARLTSAGSDMATFPVEPRVARMLLESLSQGCSWDVLAVASALHVVGSGSGGQHSRRLLLQPPRHKQTQQVLDYEAAVAEICDFTGDHVTYANLFREMDECGGGRGFTQADCRERFVNYAALKRGMEMRNQLGRFLRRFGHVQAMGLSSSDGGGSAGELERAKAIRKCVTAGFFFNVAKLGHDGLYYTLRSRTLVTPAANSVFSTHSQLGSEYIVFGETVDGARGGIELKSVSAIEAKWLRELAPHYWE